MTRNSPARAQALLHLSFVHNLDTKNDKICRNFAFEVNSSTTILSINWYFKSVVGPRRLQSTRTLSNQQRILVVMGHPCPRPATYDRLSVSSRSCLPSQAAFAPAQEATVTSFPSVDTRTPFVLFVLFAASVVSFWIVLITQRRSTTNQPAVFKLPARVRSPGQLLHIIKKVSELPCSIFAIN